MKGLYQRVLKGVYPKIPSHYSNDLNAVLKTMLQVDPKKRPTCERLIHLPVFTAKHNEGKLQEQGQSAEAINMLGTIKLPSNLKLISDNLPGSNYDSDKSDKDPPPTKQKVKINKPKRHSPEIGLDEIKEVNENEFVAPPVRRRPKPKVVKDIYNSNQKNKLSPYSVENSPYGPIKSDLVSPIKPI